MNKKEALTNPQLWNLYAYCRNNPITYFDPDGRDIKSAISNWWKNAPINFFIKGDFKGGFKQLGKHLSEQLSDPKFVLGFVGGVKYKSIKPYPFITKKGFMQWRDPKTGRFVKSPIKFPEGFNINFGDPKKWKSFLMDISEEVNRFKKAAEFFKNAESSKAATSLLDAIEVSLKNIKKK